MVILGIETTCDETAASVAEIKNNKIKVLSNIISSQIDIHKKYGGVVPEVAARQHTENILPVINQALESARIERKDAPQKIKAIAVASGPGLVTSLIVGVETAKTLSYVWNVPLISVNHIEGHVYSGFINTHLKQIKFPTLILTVSGGHTNLTLMKGHGKYQILGETRDDAAGESFDKAAKIMGLEYPGGPIISREAEKAKNEKLKVSALPRPMIDSLDFDFSFSGLKTALFYSLKKDKNWRKKIPQYSLEFQQAVIDTLIHKFLKAAKKYKPKTAMLAGGVAANKELRKQIKKACEEDFPEINFLIPDLKYCTDNAAMIAVAGHFKKKFTPWQKLKINLD